jgi:hypothetical protein
MNRPLLILMLSLGALTPSLIQASEPPAVAARNPQATRVALLPVLNATGDPTHAGRGDDELHRLFFERGFSLSESEAVAKALAAITAPDDPKDPAARPVAALDEIAQTIGADWVVLVVLDSVDQRKVTAPITDTMERVTQVKLRIWVLDRATGKSVLAGVRSDSQLRADAFDPGASAGKRLRDAVSAAVRDSLRELLLPYPVKRGSIAP